jgi:hypothetical protein
VLRSTAALVCGQGPLVGHSGTTVTEEVYRKQIRPVITEGAEVMGRLFPGTGDTAADAQFLSWLLNGQRPRHRFRQRGLGPVTASRGDRI